jgi:hypothetical protein
MWSYDTSVHPSLPMVKRLHPTSPPKANSFGQLVEPYSDRASEISGSAWGALENAWWGPEVNGCSRMPLSRSG